MDIHDDRGKGPSSLEGWIQMAMSKVPNILGRRKGSALQPQDPSPRVERAWCGALVSRRDTNLTLAGD